MKNPMGRVSGIETSLTHTEPVPIMRTLSLRLNFKSLQFLYSLRCRQYILLPAAIPGFRTLFIIHNTVQHLDHHQPLTLQPSHRLSPYTTCQSDRISKSTAYFSVTGWRTRREGQGQSNLPTLTTELL